MHSEFSIQVKNSIRQKLNLLLGNFPYINAKKKKNDCSQKFCGFAFELNSWKINLVMLCLKCVYFLIKLIATITCLHAHSKLRVVCRGEQET